MELRGGLSAEPGCGRKSRTPSKELAAIQAHDHLYHARRLPEGRIKVSDR